MGAWVTGTAAVGCTIMAGLMADNGLDYTALAGLCAAFMLAVITGIIAGEGRP